MVHPVRFGSGGSSPLTRGAPGGSAEGRVSGGLIPAHAGSTRRTNPDIPMGGAHPRSRGEHMLMARVGVWVMGSSPLTRGAHRYHPRRRLWFGLIPAHAGSTLSPLVSNP